MIRRKTAVLVVGFDDGQFLPSEHFEWWVMQQETSKNGHNTGREHLYVLNTLGTDCNLMLLNLEKKLSPFEIVLSHIVYSNRTPIIGVGDVGMIDDPIISEFVCNYKHGLDDAMEYLNNYYV